MYAQWLHMAADCRSAILQAWTTTRAGFPAQPPHLCWADCLAQLAGNAALLARGVAAQGVLAAEAWADGTLLEGVVDLSDNNIAGWQGKMAAR